MSVLLAQEKGYRRPQEASQPLSDSSDSGKLDELLLIVPSCGHIFTVATLDAVVQLHEYYEKDGKGKWSSPKVLAISVVPTPKCPRCGSALNANRYRRAWKQAEFNLCERNVIGYSSKLLAKACHDFRQRKVLLVYTAPVDPSHITAAPKVNPTHWKALMERREEILNTTGELPLAQSQLPVVPPNVRGLSAREYTDWRKYCDWPTMMGVYEAATRLAESKYSLVQGWEHDAKAKDSASGGKKMKQESSTTALDPSVGPPPVAEKEFVIKAFLLSMDVRFELATAAETWVKGLLTIPQITYSHLLIWAAFAHFLLRSCRRDAPIARSIALQSNYLSQTTLCQLYAQRARVEVFRFDVFMRLVSRTCTSEDAKRMLIEEASAAREEARSVLSEEMFEWKKLKLPSDLAQWYSDNFSNQASQIIEQWGKLADNIKDGTRPSPSDIKYPEIATIYEHKEKLGAFRLVPSILI